MQLRKKEWKEVEVWEWEEGGWRDEWVLRRRSNNTKKKPAPWRKKHFKYFSANQQGKGNILSASRSPAATSATDWCGKAGGSSANQNPMKQLLNSPCQPQKMLSSSHHGEVSHNPRVRDNRLRLVPQLGLEKKKKNLVRAHGNGDRALCKWLYFKKQQQQQQTKCNKGCGAQREPS